MKYILALLLTLTASLSDAAVINQEQVFKAVARVHSDTGRGTATAFMEDDNSVFFLTCYHVVQEAAPTVQLQREGFEGPELPTTVVYKSFSSGERRDLAVLQLDKSLLNGYVIPIVPLAREGLTITPRSIYSIGSPEGGRLTMFEGHVVGVSSALEFRPVPKHGRSGSSLTMNIRSWA
jgi:S1-C subfamily serine protease